MALLIKWDETQIPLEPRNGTVFAQDEVQAYVGKYLETFSLGDHYVLVVNELGKLDHLLPNRIATVMYALDSGLWPPEADVASVYEKALEDGDEIVGDVVLCLRSQLERGKPQ